ncbi:MAG TPA: CDP-glycerol glycerophosphotransferase family protein [Nocardioidaceae bacterium]|nr:CDP-glycerol glycerophosphotransferase family protein [Nocardioidaceae bacterium]
MSSTGPRVAQEGLHLASWPGEQQPDAPTRRTPDVVMHVVYSSFMGRYCDNPRVLHERLRDRPGTEHTWLLDPAHSGAFPDDVRTVSIADPAVPGVLESADLVVANTHTEVEWEKREGARYLQTWHGTPLKRIHHDVLFAPVGRLDYLDRDIARWDALLSPNAVSTPRLRKAFGFDGPVWETGYPRNDLLVSPEAPAVRASVRAELGLADDETVVLYAPTWRDDEKFTTDPEAGREIPLHLHLGALVQRLDGERSGTRHRVLARIHNMVTDRMHAEVAPGVLDVSYYRDVRELYLAADVLVTDYSSVMFDFALTGRPIVLYAYDLDRFRDKIRGFYFDLFPSAPGPVVRTEDALVEALLDLEVHGADPHIPDAYAEAYASFRAAFGHLEDGHATDRVLEQLGL